MKTFKNSFVIFFVLISFSYFLYFRDDDNVTRFSVMKSKILLYLDSSDANKIRFAGAMESCSIGSCSEKSSFEAYASYKKQPGIVKDCFDRYEKWELEEHRRQRAAMR
jgi:hypothetical protein